MPTRSCTQSSGKWARGNVHRGLTAQSLFKNATCPKTPKETKRENGWNRLMRIVLRQFFTRSFSNDEFIYFIANNFTVYQRLVAPRWFYLDNFGFHIINGKSITHKEVLRNIELRMLPFCNITEWYTASKSPLKRHYDALSWNIATLTLSNYVALGDREKTGLLSTRGVI